MNIVDLTATELAAKIRSKDISPVAAIEASLDRIEAQAEINAFITVTADRARAAAREAERAVMRGDRLGPLHGIPVSIKDVVDVEGVRTTYGSRIFENNIAKTDAVTVARLKAAGAIVIGKTTTPEMAHKQRNDAPLFGLTLNPVDHSRTCGASSGGAAAAVAAKMGQLALGTDGGGSIRIPAACCGIVGFKPTLGIVPHLSVADAFSANAYSGPMARNVADTTLMFDVLQGVDRRDPYGQREIALARRDHGGSFKGLKVAWLPRCGNILDPAVETVTKAAVDRIASLGAEVNEVFLDFVSLEETFLIILQTMLASRMLPLLEEHHDKIDPSLLLAVDRGLARSGVELQRAGASRTECFRQVQSLFESYDVIVSPVLSSPPLLVEGLDPNGRITIAGKDAGTIRGAWYPYTFPFNLTGHPAISMPCGRDENDLPIGLQIVGSWYGDRDVLALAETLEGALG